MTTVSGALADARASGIDRLDAQLLLGHVLGCSRTWLLAHDDAIVDRVGEEAFAALVARRADGEPLAYLVGEREFHGLAFAVDRRVLVPRPDTEALVDWALECLAGVARPAVADLGTGSGAIAVAIAVGHAGAEVTAVDVDAGALAVAQANARRHGVRLRCLQGSWWQPLGGERYDLVVSNPPYVAEGDPHLPALRHEPPAALLAGADGLRDLRLIVAGARDHLRPGGRLLLEHGSTQAEAVAALLATAGFGAIQTRTDLAGHARCTGGRL